MAYGSVTGYEPLPDGSYNFAQADGRKMRLFGPAAESLKARIDASASLAPQPVAGPGGGVTTDDLVVPEGGFGGFGGQVPQPTAAPAPAEAAPSPVDPNAQAQANAIATQSIKDVAGAQKAQQPRFVQRFREKDGSVIEQLAVQNPDGTTRYLEGDGTTRIFRPGSAGSKGGIRETTSSLTQQGGFDPSEEHIAAKEEQAWRERAALEVGAAAAEERAAMEQGFFEEQKRQLELRAAEAEAEQNDRAAKVAQLEGKYDQAERDFRTAGVDESRYSKSFMGVLGHLGAALGAFASTASGTPNFAMQILQSKIADDIKAQETALNIKRDARDNMLGVLNRELGSMDLAKKAVEGIRLRQAETHFKSLAAQAQSKEVEAKYLESAAALEGKYIDWREQYRLAAEGQITKSKNFVNQPGSAGRPAGYDLPTTEQAGTLRKLAGADQEQKMERAVPNATIERVTNATKAIDQAARLEKLLAQENANVLGEELDDPTKGPIDSLSFKKKDVIRQETRRAAQAFQDARGKSDMDAILATEDAIGSGSIASRKRAVQMLRREMAQEIKTALQGIPPEQAERMMRSMSPEVLEVITRDQEGAPK